MSNEKTVNRIDVGKRAGIVGIFANILLAIGELVVGIISSSVSIIADACICLLYISQFKLIIVSLADNNILILVTLMVTLK